jgi:hypothetical protein
MLNRCLVTVKAKEPFREWLLSLPNPCDETIDEINDDPSAYLLPEFDDDEERDRILQEYFPMIFEDQLFAWWIQAEDWPQNRNFQMFKKWFDVEFHSIVEDLVDDALVDQQL